MDPISIAAIITGVLALLTSIGTRVTSSKCFGEKGIDIEFNKDAK